MKKALIAVLTSICMAFIGLVIGVFLDETFGGASFTFTPQPSQENSAPVEDICENKK